MKRISAILLALVLCFSILSVTALAATTDSAKTAKTAKTASEGNVLVHAYVPEGISPSFWTWDKAANKNGYSVDWPGEPMTKEGDWWIIEAPNWCDGMIVNDGGNGKQTQDMIVEKGKELWIVVNPFDWTQSKFFYEEPDLTDPEVLPKEAPKVEEVEVSRPTLGATNPTTATKAESNTPEINYGYRRMKVLVIIGTALLAIVAVAFVLSIPKKIR